MNKKPILVEDVTKVFKHPMKLWEEITAVKNASFEIEEGKIIGFVGHNGAGKTTTIKMLMGFIQPTSGSMQLFGKSPGNVSIKRKLGFLPERPYFYEELTAEELLNYFGLLSEMKKDHIKTATSKILKKVGLEHARKRRLSSFSKGMLQRIGLATSIIHDPELVVMDEPMSGLDPIGRREVAQIIRDLKKEGKTVLFSSHILSDIENLSDKVLIIENGAVTKYGTSEEIVSQEDIVYKIQFFINERERDAAFNQFPGLKQDESLMVLISKSEDEMNKQIQKILESGYKIRSAGPVYPKLEDIVFTEVEGSGE